MQKSKPTFAITPELPKIVSLIEKHQVVVIDVPTGSGKSMCIPTEVVKTFKRVKIHISQPTRAAVIGLYEFQKNFVKTGLGWAAEGNKEYKHTDSIVYATSGHIKHSVLKCFKGGKALDWKFCDALMLDEIHTGSKDLSIIIDLWCEARKQKVKIPKLILSTATATGITELIERLDAVVFSSTFRKTKIEIRYERMTHEEPDDEDLLHKAAYVAGDLLAETKQHGIVFCSGAGECEDMIDAIKGIVEERRYEKVFGKTINVIPCFSQCKPEEIMLAISAAPPNTIHVVCATNVAESSLTIPDVKWVVDTMSEKRSTMRGGRFHLGVTWISKNSAEQRAGRTGRTVPNGICHRMMTKESYDKLEQIRPLEIRNSPISSEIIELLDCGLDPCKIITELEAERLAAAKKTLVDTGCIIIERETADSLVAEVTDCGRFVVQLPMDVYNAATLYYYMHGHKSGLQPLNMESHLFLPVAVMTLIDTYGPSPLWFPRRKKDEDPRSYQARMAEYSMEHFREYESDCPVETLTKFFMACMKESDKNIYTAPWRIAKWSTKNSGNAKKLKEVCMNMKRICYTLDKGSLTEFDSEFTESDIRCVVRRIRLALGLTYHEKLLRPAWTRYGLAHLDNRMETVNADTLKTVVRCCKGVELLSLSDIQIRNKKTQKVTNISSLWVQFERTLDESGIPIRDIEETSDSIDDEQ